MSLAGKYCDLVRKNFKTYYATWLPVVSMKLGDYGIMDDNVFTKQGNIRDYNVSFSADLGGQVPDFEFTSTGTTSVNIAAGTSGFVNAGLKFTFASQFDAYFLAADCQMSTMQAQNEVLVTLAPIFKAKKMKNYFIVTAVLNSKITTVLLSSDKNAEFSLEAKSPSIPQIDLKDPSVSADIKTASKMGIKIQPSPGLTPVIALAKVKI
jgi:hypothetical protein